MTLMVSLYRETADGRYEDVPFDAAPGHNDEAGAGGGPTARPPSSCVACCG
jgi:hypothetical protein